ncbi:PadR family transcriptional regulator [Promicromonospora sukumoe]|uniref:PadR family transcriptional regulator n=1 Tax=Promicromonospora sukumoe TaxID=88382 RepID=UPI00036F47AE|nr:PadR family transcriptional regulator [Promicromonospora sukumoe]
MRTHDNHSQDPGSSGRRGGRRRGFLPTFEGPMFGPVYAMAGGPGPDFGPRDFGPGFGPGGGPRGFGPRGPHGGGRRGSRGPRRAGRGEIRAAILLLLAEQPMHGYQIIGELADRTDGRWRPSAGAVYPALSLLADEGLVVLSEDGGRKLATLTDEGTAYVEQHKDELGTPWEQVGHGHGRELRHEVRALADAVEQVARTGTPEQVAAVTKLLEKARREVYLTLAGEAPTSEA